MRNNDKKPSYKTHTSKTGQKTEISDKNGVVTTKVTQKGGDYAVRVVKGNQTYYKTFDKYGKETTNKQTPVKETEAKATHKLTQDQMNSIPFKNDAINKFSEKVVPIWEGLGKTYTDTKGRTHTPIITSGRFGTQAQADSSRAVVTGTNLVNTASGPLFKEPTKKTPLVKPGNTGAGALVKRTKTQQTDQLKINNQR